MEDKQSSELRKGGVPSRRAMTLKYLGYSEEALEVLVETMRNKTAQDTARLAAARAILDKVIPDMKAVELSGEDSAGLVFKLVIDKKQLEEMREHDGRDNQPTNSELPEAAVNI